MLVSAENYEKQYCFSISVVSQIGGIILTKVICNIASGAKLNRLQKVLNRRILY